MTATRSSDAPTQDGPLAELRISVLHVRDCPSVGRLRALVEAALKLIGSTAAIEEIEGSYSSPTLLINGIEIDGYPLGTAPACRIDLPTQQQIASAILAADARGGNLQRTGEGSA